MYTYVYPYLNILYLYMYIEKKTVTPNMWSPRFQEADEIKAIQEQVGIASTSMTWLRRF